MNGRVIAIFIAQAKGAPMREIQEVRAGSAFGLEGDRYGEGKGSWSTPGTTHRQVSLIAIEAIEAANRELTSPFALDETRRNIITHGAELNAWVGREFRIGTTRLRGTKHCDPCNRPAILAKKKGFEHAFAGYGGLCAEVIGNGTIRCGDAVLADETQDVATVEARRG